MAGSTKVGTAFIPVSDPQASARWYERALGLRTKDANAWAAQLEGAVEGATAVTLMGPQSGIRTEPGLPFATCNFLVDDLAGTQSRLVDEGHAPSAVDGADDVCLFFTVNDPDGNLLLIVDR